jgi:hypothetical protein
MNLIFVIEISEITSYTAKPDDEKVQAVASAHKTKVT